VKYVEYVNGQVRAALQAAGPVVSFGQNIDAGSCLGGLCRNLPKDDRHLVLNTPNVENTLVGMGFGLMLDGVSGVFFMKQQDFLLLGIDPMVNTYNYVRQRPPAGSFTIVTIIVDLGYQGIQSSLNNFADFCSIARVPGYTITNRHDADRVIGRHLVRPGFRILGVSQRLFNQEILGGEEPQGDEESEILQYGSGSDVTIVSFNFSLPQAMRLRDEMRASGISASLFSVNAVLPVDWSRIIADARSTRRVVLIDDSKSANRPCYQLAAQLYQQGAADRVIVVVRESTDALLCPHPETFDVDCGEVLRQCHLDQLAVKARQ
jgi:pyruvate/2-oxoglutarate/acetoin dehydrogenase E1 component